MAKQKGYITNFTKFTAHEGGGLIRIVKNDAGEEMGFEVEGMLTTFDVRNENGLLFTRQSYDKFVDDYFIKNSLNVVLCLLHNDYDIRMVCGKVKEMEKTEQGVRIVGFVPKSAYFYNLIKNYIELGILQGFSNAGGLLDYDYDKDTDTLKVTDFALLHASLVCNPADTGAKLQTVNTVFKGFHVETFEATIDNEINQRRGDASDLDIISLLA